MSGLPILFDRALQRRRLQRAHRSGFLDLLVARAAEELADRLTAIMRDFPVAADIGTPTDAGYRVLAAHPRVGDALRAAPALIHGDSRHLVADEEALPFGHGRLSLITSLLALQNLNDLPGALAQIRRALAPDGLLIAALFGQGTLKELRAALAEAESELTGGISPRVAPFADVRDLGGLLQRAGFALPVTDVDSVTLRYSHPLALMQDLRAMGLTNSLAERLKGPTRRTLILRACEIYAARFADPDGRVRASFDIIWLTGWAPHESQQKPLKPGSAKARLADALKAIELSAGEKPGG
jgi:SAM-dependent methyltransferase